MRKLINKIIHFLGRENYTLDESISFSQILIIVWTKSICLFRGLFFFKPFLGSSKGLLFVGSGSQIKFKKKFYHGKTLQIGTNVNINCLSRKGIDIGENVTIKDNTIIECTGVFNELGETLVIGNNVGISQGCFIQVRGKVIIGNDVIMGPGVMIFSENHNFENSNILIRNQGTNRKGILIKDNVWIGANSKILDGVTLEENSVVAAGSVVTKSFPPNSIIAGIPAKKIKNIG